MKHTLLFVDDEKSILTSIKRLFFQDDFEILLAQGAKEGLALLLHHQPSVIITDMRMPEMDGIQFLKAASKICPDAVRLVLSGYADIETIMNAVNEGHIWRYITKPWNDSDLRVTIKNSIAFYEQSTELKKLLEDLAAKSEELVRLNEALEVKVAERTWQLQQQTNLMNQILDNASIGDILTHSAQAIARTVNAKAVSIFAPFLDPAYFSLATQPSDSDKELAERAVRTGSVAGAEQGFAFPLLSGHSVVGAVLILGSEIRDEQVLQRLLDGLFSVVRIALSQQKMLKDAPQLLNDIDKIIGEI